MLAIILAIFATPAHAHGPWHGMKNSIGGSCCSDVDKECRRVPWRPEGGRWGSVLLDGEEWRVLEEHLLGDRQAPPSEEGWTACYRTFPPAGGQPPRRALYCFVPPPAGT